jgi:hypothetical protein
LFEVLVQLEYKRRLFRKRVLGMFGRRDNNYFGVALIVLAISMMTPLLPVSLPIMGVGSSLLIIVGIFALLTIVFIPIGLFFL